MLVSNSLYHIAMTNFNLSFFAKKIGRNFYILLDKCKGKRNSPENHCLLKSERGKSIKLREIRSSTSNAKVSTILKSLIAHVHFYNNVVCSYENKKGSAILYIQVL